jgi:hypothetical protein
MTILTEEVGELARHMARQYGDQSYKKNETAGARCAKWEFNRTGWGNMSNDFAVYRLADIRK